MTRDKELHRYSMIDRVLDLHLRIGKRNLNQESPKRAGAKVNGTGTRARELSVNLGGSRQRWLTDAPAVSTIHIKLRAGHPLLQHVRPLELLAIRGLPIMLCHRVRRVRAQVSDLGSWLPVMLSGFFGVPAVLEGRIGVVRRTGVSGYDGH